MRKHGRSARVSARAGRVLLVVLALAALTVPGCAPSPPPLEPEPEITGPSPLLVGVMNAHAFRLAEAPRPVLRRIGAPSRFRPVGIAEQFETLGHRAFHFPVYVDPQTGGFARGRLAGVAALRQPGLKVLDPHDPAPDAVCATLMLCLMAVDAASRAFPDHAVWAVVVDLRQPGDPRWYRWWPPFLRWLAPQPPEAPARPTADAVLREIALALPAPRRAASLALGPETAGRIAVVVRGAAGHAPASGVHFDGHEAGVFAASATFEAEVREMRLQRAAVVILEADWATPDVEVDPEGARLDALTAAQLGVDAVLLTPRAAR